MHSRPESETRNATRKASACSFRTLETLEQRQLMAFIPTDMTQLAQYYNQQHVGPTQLYLNFDGGTITDDQADGTETVSAFTAQPGADRGKAIQDIIYRVSEVFAPFNVQVRRMYGAGNYATSGGATTVFIGADAKDVNTAGKNPVKTTAGWTPNNSSDYPGDIKGLAHVPNSDDYDLAFIDPVGNFRGSNQTVWDDLSIAQAIIHEAGHSFGLAHVLSSPTPDLMSYDAGDARVEDQTFPITSNNFDPTTGQVKQQSSVVPKAFGYIDAFGAHIPIPSTITTQNSFTYLSQVLGKLNLGLDAYPHHVADGTAVDNGYFVASGVPDTLTLGSSHTGFVAMGSSDVFNLQNTGGKSQLVKISVTTPNTLNPQILIYDNSGNTLIDAYHGRNHNVSLAPYTSYKLVVGGFEGRSYGDYSVSINTPFAFGHVLTSPAFKLSTLLRQAQGNGFAGKFSNKPVELNARLLTFNPLHKRFVMKKKFDGSLVLLG
jgi:hypothetical protein